MGKRRMIPVAVAFVWMVPSLLQAEVDCPPNTTKNEAKTACLFTAEPVLKRLTPTLSPEAALLATPPVVLNRIHALARSTPPPPASPPPGSAIPESVPDPVQSVLDQLCKENQSALDNSSLSETATLLRTAIKTRCDVVASIQGPNLNRPNVLRMTEVELRAATATGIDNAPSDPKGAVLSLEQSVLVGVTDFVVAPPSRNWPTTC